MGREHLFDPRSKPVEPSRHSSSGAEVANLGAGAISGTRRNGRHLDESRYIGGIRPSNNHEPDTEEHDRVKREQMAAAGIEAAVKLYGVKLDGTPHQEDTKK